MVAWTGMVYSARCMPGPPELATEATRIVRVSFATLRKGVPKSRILTKSFVKFLENELPTSAAAISYFLLLAMFPFLLAVFDLSNHFPGLGELNRYALETITASLPPGARAAVVDYLQAIAHPSIGEMVTCVILILWAGSWAFTIIEKALNRIWRTECRSFLRGRGIALLMMLGVGTLLGVSAVVTGLLTFLQTSADQLAAELPQAGIQVASPFWHIVFGIVGLLLTISLFMLFYIVMPNTHVSIIEALPGAVIAGAAWEVAKYLFAWSLGEVPYDQLYGSIAAVVAILTWIYISNLIMLFGAQITALFHCEYLMDDQKLGPSLQSRPLATPLTGTR